MRPLLVVGCVQDAPVSHFTLLPAAGARFCRWSHFVDEEVKAQKGHMMRPDSLHSSRGGAGLDPGAWTRGLHCPLSHFSRWILLPSLEAQLEIMK